MKKIQWKESASALLIAAILLIAPALHAAEWVGTPAPVIKLADQDNKIRSLQDFKGKWIALYFYPKDKTPGCTQEAKKFRDYWNSYQQHNITIIGVSGDDVSSHKDFATTHNLPFLLLADENFEMAKAMGVARGFGPLRFASRQTFLIDPEGTIVYHYASVDTQKHAEQVLADVIRLSANSDKPGN